MSYSSLESLVSKFLDILTEEEKNYLEAEFCAYQYDNYDFESAEVTLHQISQI